jgi:hypothetical protein
LKPEDSENAIKEMVNKGALKVKISDLTLWGLTFERKNKCFCWI